MICLLAVAGFLESIGCLVSKSIRCLFLLISIQFFGKAGRGAVKTLLFGLVITGPLRNLSKNALEINRVFICSSELAYNLSKTHLDLMILPFRTALEELQNVSQVRESFGIVDDVVDALQKEIEQEDDVAESFNGSSANPAAVTSTNSPIESLKDASQPRTDPKTITENYYRKLSKRCQEQLKSGQEDCAEIFGSLYDVCNEKFPGFLAMQLCWMMDIESLCYSKMNISTEGLCTPADILDDSFGETYLELLKERDELMEEIESVEINFSYNESDFIDKIKPEEIKSYQGDLESIFEKKKYILDYLLNLTNILIAFTYIKIIIRSVFYISSFLMELDFENIYVTSFFREIDQKRAQRGERSILPLKKIERISLVEDPLKKRRIQNDYRDLIYHLLKFLLELMAVTVFILLDWLLVVALEVVAKNGKMDFTQKGEVEVNVTIFGEGMMASVVESIISGLSVNRTVEKFEDNQECLPVPSKLSTMWFIKIYGLFLGILIMIYNESYTNRLLFFICAFHYPKRQHERSLFLYNKILQSRRDYFRHMKTILEREVQEDDAEIEIPCKKLCDLWKKIFPSSRICRICQDVDERKSDWATTRYYQKHHQDFVECSNEDCLAVYCRECWGDLEEICVLCSGIDTGSVQ
ncbi:protein sneaky [Lutzomyia longipalpis]|uniref:protein sneaky n=1 Tax=Lutzomyia longipalpis TaxID=7200 RepID=UPI002483E3D0|nr:protein sneaky [Lutzomyia longipalpis]